MSKKTLKESTEMYTKDRKTSVNLNLKAITVGYLWYMREVDEANSFNELIDALVDAYVEHYAAERNLNPIEVDRHAMRLFENSRLTKRVLTPAEQKRKAKAAIIAKQKNKETPTAIDYRKLQEGALKGDY